MSLFLVAFLGALLALDSVSVGQTMLSRPLPTGFLIGTLLGDPFVGAQVGALLELYLLVVVPAGGGRYPEGSVATAVGVSAAVLAPGLTGLVFGVTGGLVWGWVAGFSQSVMRRGTDQWVPIPTDTPVTERSIARAQVRGILVDFVRAFVMVSVGVLLARILVPLLVGAWVLPVGWTVGLLVGGGLVSVGVLLRALTQDRRGDWALVVISALIGWWAAGGAG